MEQPLVSIIVISYHSAPFIEATLDSIYDQTYPNIELIICDDGSTDNTQEICSAWLENHRTRFSACKTVFSRENFGIVKNCNNGLKICAGYWIKMLAADDLLLPEFTASIIEHSLNSPSYSIIACMLQAFNSKSGENIKIFPTATSYPDDKTAQLKLLLKGTFIKAPGAIIKKTLLEKLNFFDERYPMLEDDPFWIKANKAGYTILLVDEVLVKYRLHDESISNSKTQFVNPLFFKSSYDLTTKIILPEMKKLKMWRAYFILYNRIHTTAAILKNGNNIASANNIVNRIFLKFLSYLKY